MNDENTWRNIFDDIIKMYRYFNEQHRFYKARGMTLSYMEIVTGFSREMCSDILKGKLVIKNDAEYQAIKFMLL